MLSEPNIFQHELKPVTRLLNDQYCMYLNTEDLYDPELAMSKSRMIGGTMVLWNQHLDPYVTIHPTDTSSFTVLVLQIPGYQISVHISLYMPTSGKDQEFVTELTNLRVCVEHLTDLYPECALFIRGDSNVNSNNKNRSVILAQFVEIFSLRRVPMKHTTYHHFLGGGAYDSEIDVLLHSDAPGVDEHVTTILCIHDYPQLLSHHDLVLSQCHIPARNNDRAACNNLVSAPRLPNTREKVIWTAEGAAAYNDLVMPVLQSLRDTWLLPTSTACMSVLLQLTNLTLKKGASMTNKAVSLTAKHTARSLRTPRPVQIAVQRLRRVHRKLKRYNSEKAKADYRHEITNYKRCVKTFRLQEQNRVERKLLTILSDNPSALYNYIRSNKNVSRTKIDKLNVQNKTYHGSRVPDGFFDAMTSLKSCDTAALLSDPAIADQLNTYNHIQKLCMVSAPLPLLSFEDSAGLLLRLKKNVKDFFSITALHYLNAGEQGIIHFQSLLNAVVAEVENASLAELNTAHGVIHFKGHKKDKNSERSYRCISTCPFLSKALDLYVRDIHQKQWNACQAST